MAAYVDRLMQDDTLIALPLGMGCMAPPSFEADIYRTLVHSALAMFRTTVVAWNQENIRATLAGHPIWYTRTVGHRGLTHQGHGPPFEFALKVAKILRADARVASGVLPGLIEEHFIANLIRVLGCIFVDLLLSSSSSLRGGMFRMEWVFDPSVQTALRSRSGSMLRQQVSTALQNVDFSAVDAAAHAIVADSSSQLPGAQRLYRLALILSLVMFQLMMEETECNALGYSVQMKLTRPGAEMPCGAA